MIKNSLKAKKYFMEDKTNEVYKNFSKYVHQKFSFWENIFIWKNVSQAYSLVNI